MLSKPHFSNYLFLERRLTAIYVGAEQIRILIRYMTVALLLPHHLSLGRKNALPLEVMRCMAPPES